MIAQYLCIVFLATLVSFPMLVAVRWLRGRSESGAGAARAMQEHGIFGVAGAVTRDNAEKSRTGKSSRH